MRHEEHDLVAVHAQQRVGEGARETAEPPVGVEERSSRIEPDPHRRHEEGMTPRIVHLAMATTRGGLMRVVETLAAVQGRNHRIAVMAPIEPHPTASGSPAVWAPLAITGNADIAGHRRLLAMLRDFEPNVVFLHAGSPGELALAAALVARRAAAVVVEHATEHYPLVSWVRDAVFARLKGRADRWLAVSAVSARSLEARWRLPAGRIGVIHNGVEAPPDGPPSAAEGALFAGGDVVLAAGRPDTGKGLDTFSAVAEALAPARPDVRWVWVGGDEQRTVGPVVRLPWSDALGWMMRRAALLLIPSRAEGLPLVLLEGWACGVAVAVSAVGGVPEVVSDGADAVLRDPNDLPAWVASVRTLLADPRARASLAQSGQAKWNRKFTADAMAARYAAIVAAVIGEGPRSPAGRYRRVLGSGGGRP